ncbi:class III lanthionine synthetase LanKC [Streptomyces sp. NPDC088196]|uniref:class III lanthionine synthetase LanKC n=1 Tax=Streptomyces sp. NPDC088196 TaxID=3154868 RepID=UPI00344C6A78
MDARYEAYLFADPVWYEALEFVDDTDSRFALADEEVPGGWRRRNEGVWCFLSPADTPSLPEQGWKVHVTTTPAAAEETVTAVWQVCRELSVPWKFLRSRFLVTALNTKYSSRSASGKTVTVYPRTDEELHAVLVALDTRLGGRPGPYVLSDLRWNAGPVSVRYGAFTPLWCERPDGTRVPAIRDPQGRPVPDARRAVFSVPDWVQVPAFLSEHMDRGDRGGATLGGYQVTGALHFSNAGGVYTARDAHGGAVVLKEARPFAGLDAQGSDAVTRLRHEYEVLRELGHLPFVPAVREYFTAWEHHFLVLEHIPGQTLSAWTGRANPLLLHQPDARAREAFAALAVARLHQLEQCVAALHASSIAFGDLHPRNVVIRPDDSVALVDFELASRPEPAHRPALGAPGFTHPAAVTAAEADLFALGCCQLAAFVPLTALMTRTPAVVSELIDTAVGAFPGIPADYRDRMTARLALDRRLRPFLPAPPHPGATPTVPSPQPHAPATRSFEPGVTPRSRRPAQTAPLLLRGIRQAATPGRADRLFPGDIAGHRPGGALGLAYGASGVLFAQHVLGAAVADEHVEWLTRAAHRAPVGTPLGLYDGLAGAAWTLHALGHGDAAPLVDRILAGPLPHSPGLFGGLTGIAHLLLDIAAVDQALALARKVAVLVGEPGLLDRPGLMYGWSGPALLFARCARVSGDERWATVARQALACDLAHGDRLANGALMMRTQGLLLPYLAHGSGGVALAALALPPARDSAEGEDETATAAARAGAAPLVAQAGLFHGRAGLAYVLAHVADRHPEWRAVAEEQGRLLSLHLADHGDGLVAHGDQVVRLSTDLATGSAGVLLALDALANPGRGRLPGAHATAA